MQLRSSLRINEPDQTNQIISVPSAGGLQAAGGAGVWSRARPRCGRSSSIGASWIAGDRQVARKADIQEKLKLALDETRMLIMGVQILIGFQLQAIVQESFATLPRSSRMCIGSALILMVCTAGLLIAPAAQHRLVENGEASPRIVALTTRLMEIALLAFAVGMALDLYVAAERIAGFLPALLCGAAAFAAALAFWHAFALIYRDAGAKQEEPVIGKAETTPLSRKIDYMLTEARVVLPGVQALLGFQLIAVLTKPFEQLPAELKIAHAFGLGMMALSIVLLLAPAAFHRLAFDGEDNPIVHQVGAIFVTAALAALAFGLGAEVMVAMGALTGQLKVGAVIATVVLLVLLGLWYAWPLAVRARLGTQNGKRLQ
jgi:hypothetical protein